MAIGFLLGAAVTVLATWAVFRSYEDLVNVQKKLIEEQKKLIMEQKVFIEELKLIIKMQNGGLKDAKRSGSSLNS